MVYIIANKLHRVFPVYFQQYFGVLIQVASFFCDSAEFQVLGCKSWKFWKLSSRNDVAINRIKLRFVIKCFPLSGN